MIKLVINSHIKYSKARKILFESLESTNFKSYIDIIMILSGCDSDIEPYLSEDGYITIHSTKNNFDYNGFNVLHTYKDHHLVDNNFYLYLHDTITFDKNFDNIFNELNSSVLDKDTNNIYISRSFHSNICLFGKNVIENYSNNFSVPLTKEEAIYLELHPNLVKNNRIIKNISFFGDVNYISERIDLNREEDIYQNGHPRKVFYYPLFGIYKWILWGKNGDFTETKIKQNNLWW